MIANLYSNIIIYFVHFKMNLEKLRNYLPRHLDIHYLYHSYFNTNSYFTEFIICIFKIFIFLKLIKSIGFLYAVIFLLLYINISPLILKLFFNLEKLAPNDLLLLGIKDDYKNDMHCLFFFEDGFDPEIIRDVIIKKGISKHEKFQRKLVRILSTFFWLKVTMKEAESRVKILETGFSSREEIINFLRLEVNKPIQTDEELPYEIKILKYSTKNGGAILFKSDHTFSDGLGMVMWTLTFSDNYDESSIPLIVKLTSSIPLYYKLFIYACNLFLFPYYSMKLLFNSKIHKRENNLFRNKLEPSRKQLLAYTDVYNFEKLHKINKYLGISFNDLMICIISISTSKFCDKFYPECDYNYLICAIPIGVKKIPKSTSDVRIANDIFGAILPLRRLRSENITKDDCEVISHETKKTIKNNLNTISTRYLFTLMNEFLPYKIQREMTRKVNDSIDVGISNMPGPAKQIFYNGFKVNDIVTSLTLGFGKAFLIIETYYNQVRISVNLDSNLGIDVFKLAKFIDHEIQNLLDIYKEV